MYKEPIDMKARAEKDPAIPLMVIVIRLFAIGAVMIAVIAYGLAIA